MTSRLWFGTYYRSLESGTLIYRLRTVPRFWDRLHWRRHVRKKSKTPMYSSLIKIIIIVLFNMFYVFGYAEKEKLIYILIWTPANFEPFNFIDMGQKAFMNCTFKNCFLTANHNYFRNILDFEVIMFNAVNLEGGISIPSNRSEDQKYFMYSVEPAGFHAIPEEFNGFFNYTFTYKLSSSVTIPCLIVKDQYNEVIGPKIDMHWMKLSEMNETSDYVKSKLQNKHIAAAWIVSHCRTPYRRLYAQDLIKELGKLGHNLHVFGICGDNTKCPQKESIDECFAIIESDYYFYLAFENSFGEDYVTEKILNGLEHYAVPVVFGSAKYNRFMPEGIYLDANVLTPAQLAAKMIEIINDVNRYYEFFKWHEYYSFHSTSEDWFSREVCNLCAFLNNNENRTNVYDNIAEWWNEIQPPWPIHEEPSSAEMLFTNLLNVLDPSSD